MPCWNELPSELFQAYGLQVEGVTKQRKIYQVATPSGCYALKPVLPSLERIAFAHRSINYLHSKGFQQAVPFILTKSGQPLWISPAQQGYCLTPWVQAREADFSQLADLQLAAATMGQLHQAATDFQPGEGWSRNVLGQWPRLWQEAWQELVDFACTAQDRYFAEQAKYALDLLEQEQSYAKQVASARTRGNFCHRDLVYHNLLINPNDQVYVIDFEYCAIEIFAADIGRFLRKAMPSLAWNWALAKQAMQSYQQYRCLPNTELHLILAYLTFPFDLWRLVRRFKTHPNAPGAEEMFAAKYQSLRATEQQKQIFLQQMTAEIELIGR